MKPKENPEYMSVTEIPVVSPSHVDMLHMLPIPCPLVSIGSSSNTRAEDNPLSEVPLLLPNICLFVFGYKR